MKQTKILHGGLAALARELKKPEWDGARYTILLDENTFQHCLPQLIAQVEAVQEAEFVELPAGEECKSIEVAAQVWQTLLEGGADRNMVIVCLGGGSVCDLGGYVAAGYMRGLRLIHVPTTLLAMADAAIGGKTAIDFGGVKNSLGHFYPAAITAIDTAFLGTLDEVQLRCGKVEMVKAAAVADPALFSSLLDKQGVSKNDLAQAIRIKTRAVKADPCDLGIRRILNFGHTFGHAAELHFDLPHGMAVGLGMKAAMYLSTRKTGLDEGIYTTYSHWINQQFDLPRPTLKDTEPMLHLMHHDKKSRDGGLQCVLLADLGAAMIDVPVSDHEVRDAFLHL